MAIITNLYIVKKHCYKDRQQMHYLKRAAHRAYRRCAKQAIHCDKEINEKPRLTPWDII
jgi:hypothetical protein